MQAVTHGRPAPAARSRPFAAIPTGMAFLVMLIAAFALPGASWWKLPQRLEAVRKRRGALWIPVALGMLELSGVDAVDDVADAVEHPMASTLGKAIWIIGLEVAVFYSLLALAILSGLNDPQSGDQNSDLTAYLADAIVGGWGEVAMHAIGGALLLSIGGIVANLPERLVLTGNLASQSNQEYFRRRGFAPADILSGPERAPCAAFNT